MAKRAVIQEISLAGLAEEIKEVVAKTTAGVNIESLVGALRGEQKIDASLGEVGEALTIAVRDKGLRIECREVDKARLVLVFVLS